MLNLIFLIIFTCIVFLLISFGVLLYITRKLSVKLKNEPDYLIWRSTYIPKKLILKEDIEVNKLYNIKVKRLNKMIDLLIFNIILLFVFLIIAVVIQEFFLLEKPSWLKT